MNLRSISLVVYLNQTFPHPKRTTPTKQRKKANLYRFAKTAAPPNSAPIPTTAVLAAAGLLVSVALAALPVAVAELRRLDTLALSELVRPESSELRLLATEPVAVARTEEMELTWEAASDVTLAISLDASDRWDEILEPRELVMLSVRSEVKSLTMLAAAEVAPAMAEERSEEAVWRMPPGWVESVAVESWPNKSWA